MWTKRTGIGSPRGTNSVSNPSRAPTRRWPSSPTFPSYPSSATRSLRTLGTVWLWKLSMMHSNSSRSTATSVSLRRTGSMLGTSTRTIPQSTSTICRIWGVTLRTWWASRIRWWRSQWRKKRIPKSLKPQPKKNLATEPTWPT